MHGMIRKRKARRQAKFSIGACAVVLGLGAVLGVSIGTVAPAGAASTVCNRRQPGGCLRLASQCGVTFADGYELIVDNGDSVTVDGQKWTCVNGTWVKASAVYGPGLSGPVLGRGQAVQGPPEPIPTCTPDTITFCIPDGTIP
jgi:hypothetical protein